MQRRELSADLVQAFLGNGQMKPERLEIERLRREAPRNLVGGMDMRGARCSRVFKMQDGYMVVIDP